MGKLRFVLSNFWLWASVLLGCVFAENLAVLTPNPRAGFNNTTYWMIAICCFLCLGIYVYLEHKKNKVKFDKILLPVMIGLTIIMVGTIFMQNSETFISPYDSTRSVTVSFTLLDKSKHAIKLIFLMAFSYVTTFTMFANRPSTRSMLFLPVILLIVAYTAFGYSLFTESKDIVAYFRSVSSKRIRSYFLNANTYGVTLLLGIMACFVINYYKPNAFTYLTIPLFMFTTVLTYSAASILVAFIAVILYFIIEIFRNVKKHFILTISIASFVLIGLTVFIVVVNQLADEHNLFVNNLEASIKYFFDTLHYGNMNGRSKFIKIFIQYGSDNIVHTIFGRGFGTSDEYIIGVFRSINPAWDAISCHNGIVQIFFTFGLVGVFAYLALFGVFGYSIAKCLAYKQRSFAFIYLICFFGLLANSFAETNNFYDLGFKETGMTLIFIMPPIVKAKYLSRPEKIEEIKKIKTHAKFDPMKVGEITAMIILILIAATIASFMSPYAILNPEIYLYIILGLVGCLLLFPYLIAMWLKSDDPVRRTLHVSFNIIGLLGFTYFIFVIGKLQDNLFLNYVASGAAALIFLFVDFVLYGLIRKDFYVSYLKITFINPLKTCFASFICGYILTFVFILITLPLGQFGALETLAVSVFYLIGFFIGAFFLPYRPMRTYMDYLNDLTIGRWQTFIARGDR